MTLALAAWTLVQDAHSCGCSHPQESSQVCTGALCSQMVAMLSPGGNPFPLLVITAGGSPPPTRTRHGSVGLQLHRRLLTPGFL